MVTPRANPRYGHLHHRQQPTEVLVVQIELRVFGDVGREDGAVRAHQAVALVRCVVRHVGFPVVFVDQAEAGDVRRASEHRHVVGVGPVFL